MAKPKRKKRQPPSNSGSKHASRTGSGLPSEPRERVPAWRQTLRTPRKDRDRLVALTLASLVAGLMMVINLDRVTHVAAEMGPGGSRHGWPWIYLKRELAEPPALLIEGRTFSWPWPAVKGEIREWDYPNLLGDMLICLLSSVATYWIVRALVARYDNWQYGIAPSDP